MGFGNAVFKSLFLILVNLPDATLSSVQKAAMGTAQQTHVPQLCFKHSDTSGGEGLKGKMHFTCLIIQSQKTRTSHFLFFVEVSERDFV